MPAFFFMGRPAIEFAGLHTKSTSGFFEMLVQIKRVHPFAGFLFHGTSGNRICRPSYKIDVRLF
ncbi:hypothetical protein [Fundicoccus culcitae]|uniref:Uncharacterized protein n=1 Tax=Fundicoccus culcitae TaxID=2969821 RepID=A0ABY5P3S4_9LACT|nr:hypothetical protein [Fundicoccus culcitae]UUX33108.1 hypothetical protein NRE15_09325 [Fundicoccus culcitae]